MLEKERVNNTNVGASRSRRGARRRRRCQLVQPTGGRLVSVVCLAPRSVQTASLFDTFAAFTSVRFSVNLANKCFHFNN